ncbi:sulfonate ABC transporter ATP-binding lipoprotein [Aeromicrobium flavum]|uniref:Sulfonate ABC transporter ATP-binding lipoprotein n=1 Tax=Aeromicrobium flavum TaxID=416568 RepID=A0A512HV98_9ACTN|nr:ABC transporter ATP-binding protein [Aeromicrobium flavum]GEO89376.1 sulfonate ABC transporter ATP-binding lipoprotein [Aeromicrobium flavum]
MSQSTVTTPPAAVVSPPVGLAARGVNRAFTVKGKELVALQDVDLEIAKGEFVSIIGPSGCGKSTLLRIFADLLPVTSGTPVVDGVTPQLAREDRRLGVVFQSANLMPWRSVLRNVALPLEVMGRSKAGREKTAAELLKMVGLEGYEKHLPRQLSGGMQQRVAIARALSTDPKVLLMDEPFGALDEITRERLNQELMEIWARLNPTVLFITHSIPEAVYLSNRVVVMAARPGRVVEVVDVDLPQPRTPEMRDAPEFHAIEARIRHLLATGGH